MTGLSYTNGGGSTHQFYPVPNKKQDGSVRKRPGVGDSGEGEEGSMHSDSGGGEIDSTTADVLLQPRAAAYGDYGFPQMYPQKGPPPYIQASQQIPAPFPQFPPQGPYFQPIGYSGQAPFLGPQYPPLGPQQRPNIKQKDDISEAAVTPKLGKKKIKGKKTGECSRCGCLVIFLFFQQFFSSNNFFVNFFCTPTFDVYFFFFCSQLLLLNVSCQSETGLHKIGLLLSPCFGSTIARMHAGSATDTSS